MGVFHVFIIVQMTRNPGKHLIMSDKKTLSRFSVKKRENDEITKKLRLSTVGS